MRVSKHKEAFARSKSLGDLYSKKQDGPDRKELCGYKAMSFDFAAMLNACYDFTAKRKRYESMLKDLEISKSSQGILLSRFDLAVQELQAEIEDYQQQKDGLLKRLAVVLERLNRCLFDPRDPDLITYDSMTIALIALMAARSGVFTAKGICQFYEAHSPALHALFHLPHPRHQLSQDTVRRILSCFDFDELAVFVRENVSHNPIDFYQRATHGHALLENTDKIRLEQHMLPTRCIDGKEESASYRSGCPNRKCKAIHTVSVYNARDLTVDCFTYTTQKNQESQAIRDMFPHIEKLPKSVFYADSLTCAPEFISLYREAGHESLLNLKGNRGNKSILKALDKLHPLLFSGKKKARFACENIVTKRNGRLVNDSFYMVSIDDVYDYIDDAEQLDRYKDAGAKSIILRYKEAEEYVASAPKTEEDILRAQKRKQTTKTQVTIRFYISSLECNEDGFNQALISISECWGLETHHGVLDNVFREDDVAAKNYNYLAALISINKLVWGSLSYERQLLTQKKHPKKDITKVRPVAYSDVMCHNSISLPRNLFSFLSYVISAPEQEES